MSYLLLLFFIALSTALKFKIALTAQEQRCFYQLISTQEKYAIEITPKTNGTYELAIKHQENDQWLHSVYRKSTKPFEEIKLHKLASKQSLYSFCIINSERDNITLQVYFRTGLELLDLKVLAEETDQEVLYRQAKWIDKQADKIIETINNSKNDMAAKQELQNMMSYKFIGFAFFGVLTVIIINGSFYFSLKKAFRQRKMI